MSTSYRASALLFVGDVSLDLTMMVDHVPDADEKVHALQTSESTGGVVANAAVASAVAGYRSRLVATVGDDIASHVALDHLRRHGVEIVASSCSGSLCRCVILIEPDGEKRLVLEPGVSMYPSDETVATLALSDVDHVHTAVYGPAARALVERCRACGISWSLDLEPASFPDGIHAIAEVIDGATVIFLNDRAAAVIGGEAARALLDLGAKSVIRTLGAKGACYSDNRETFSVAVPAAVSVVDTTGAGDCLAGWYVGGISSGLSQCDALRQAVAAATLSCSRIGTQSSYPDAAEVRTLLNNVESHS